MIDQQHEASACSGVPGVLRESVGWPLARVAAALSCALSDALAPHALNLRTFSVLAMVSAGAARTQLAIAQTLGLDKSTLVSAVDELEGRGLVTRTSDPDDRRARILQLTAGGVALLARAETVVRETESRLFEDLEPGDAAQLRRVLIALIGGPLRAYFDRAGSCL